MHKCLCAYIQSFRFRYSNVMAFGAETKDWERKSNNERDVKVCV